MKAWALGIVASDPEVVLGSEDGGRTWTTLATFEQRRGFRGLAFVDAEHGWLVGGESRIMSTRDGGRTWDSQRDLLTGEGLEIGALYFAGAHFGMLGGAEVGPGRPLEAPSQPYIAVTSDGGRSWGVANLPEPEVYNSQIWKACLTSRGFGVAVGLGRFGGTFTLLTADYGRTWTDVSERVPGFGLGSRPIGKVFRSKSVRELDADAWPARFSRHRCLGDLPLRIRDVYGASVEGVAFWSDSG